MPRVRTTKYANVTYYNIVRTKNIFNQEDDSDHIWNSACSWKYARSCFDFGGFTSKSGHTHSDYS